MSRVLQISLLLIVIFLAGCSNISNYDDDETVAVVKEQEITIGDLRFLYSDDSALDYLDWAIAIELVKQEVKDLDLDVFDDLYEMDNDKFEELSLRRTKDEDGESIRKFAKSQAKKLGMNTEEFQRKYTKEINEQNAYMITYLEKNLGEVDFDIDDEEEVEKFNQNGEYLLEALVKENKDEIEVFIH